MAMAAKLPVDGGNHHLQRHGLGLQPLSDGTEPVSRRLSGRGGERFKLIAAGFERENAYLTFQEYFERLGSDPTRWGKPLAALLGALDAQLALGLGAIGGKDSMSGSFEKMDVPPTLVSFATAVGPTSRVTSLLNSRPSAAVSAAAAQIHRRPAA